MGKDRFYAHTADPEGCWEPLARHLAAVAERAAQFLASAGRADSGRAAGLLHDLGKYGDAFQRRLRGQARHVDHWSAGAWAALMQYKREGVAAALAIQGHHIGLLQGDHDSLRGLDPARLRENHPKGLTLSGPKCGPLLERLREDALVPPPALPGGERLDDAFPAAAMLDVRMLFSALVDADYLATEEHFKGPAARPQGPELRAAEALRVLNKHVESLPGRTKAAEAVLQMRADLLCACRQAAAKPPGLFTLTAPTGSGKTLAMLAFALDHAARHGLRRVIAVIPFLTIIEQTAGDYKNLFGSALGENYVLEHHSLAGTRPASREDDDQEDAAHAERLLAENWDAPLIVTTSVQFLESLFANRPSACRKLHRIARSVVLFDEVQTLPPRLAVPTLASLSHLSRRYGTTVVFATATQPAFRHLHERVCSLSAPGWTPKEIAPPALRLYDRVRRTRVRWPEPGKRTNWQDLAEDIVRLPQALCIVNVRRHARELAELLKEAAGGHGLFHLSTDMCPAHREAVLAEVRRRLPVGAPCRLVSTQCVEAGVDLDFPVVYRALGPLEAVAQAAGRCNRAGRLPFCGQVNVFVPEDEKYPPGCYEQAAQTTKMLLKELGPDGMDIDNPALFQHYYSEFYSLTRIGQATQGTERSLEDAIRRHDFENVASLYRLIPRSSVNILVPYDEAAYAALAEEARTKGLLACWMRRARPHTVSLLPPKEDAPIRWHMDPVPLGARRRSEEWFIYLTADHYDRELLGLVPPEASEGLPIM